MLVGQWIEPFWQSRGRCSFDPLGQDSFDLLQSSPLPGKKVPGLSPGFMSDLCKEIISASLVLHDMYSPSLHFSNWAIFSLPSLSHHSLPQVDSEFDGQVILCNVLYCHWWKPQKDWHCVLDATCSEGENKPPIQDRTAYYLSKLFSMSSVSLERNRRMASCGFNKIIFPRNSFSDQKPGFCFPS